MDILDPTHEGDARGFESATRLTDLSSRRVAILSNGKQGTRPFFDALEKLLLSAGAADVLRLTKANYSAPADTSLFEQAAGYDALIAGIGDWGSCSSCSLHDAVTAEGFGLPAVGIMTTQFVSAAQMMARVLGAPDYPFAIVDHPISSASAQQLQARAEQAMQQSMKILRGS